jgi:hypothetical protein
VHELCDINVLHLLLPHDVLPHDVLSNSLMLRSHPVL